MTGKLVWISRSSPSPGNLLSGRVCTQEELIFLKSPQDFCRIWAMKESAVKLTGEGITGNFREILTLHPDMHTHTLPLENGAGFLAYSIYDESKLPVRVLSARELAEELLKFKFLSLFHQGTDHPEIWSQDTDPFLPDGTAAIANQFQLLRQSKKTGHVKKLFFSHALPIHLFYFSNRYISINPPAQSVRRYSPYACKLHSPDQSLHCRIRRNYVQEVPSGHMHLLDT